METPSRCLGCGYILDQLPEPRCPECGRCFDPLDSSTFTTKPLFVAWQYWLPVVYFSIFAGVVLYALVLSSTENVGWAITIFLPFAVGSVLGYGVRMRWSKLIRFALIAMAGIGLLSLLGGITGLFCTILLFAIALGPLLLGALSGSILRGVLKRSNFNQRSHLPVLILLMAQPFGVAAIEHFVVYQFASRVVETSMIMPVDANRAWNSAMFYEQVKHSPPLLLRLGLSRPLYSYGSMEQVGDTKTCVYDQGILVKKITRVETGKLIEFKVIQQGIELCGSRLKGGSFRFEPIGDHATRVTLSTEYEPILAPRFAWQPWEDASIHTLHGFVLAGMREEAENPDGERR